MFVTVELFFIVIVLVLHPRRGFSRELHKANWALGRRLIHGAFSDEYANAEDVEGFALYAL